MAEKKNFKYKIQLQETELKDGTPSERSVIFEFQNHDDILSLIQLMKSNEKLENENDCTELIVGLKLFSEVMLRNKKNPLFRDFFPSFSEFMKKLKE